MRIASVVIFFLWGISIASGAWALVALIRRGLWLRYPLLSFFLGMGTLRSLLLVHALIIGGKIAYTNLWLHSQPLVIATEASLLIEGYVIQAHRVSRRFFLYGAAAMVVFAAISAAVVVLTSGVAVLPGSKSPRAYLTVRYYETGCFLIVVLYRFLFRIIQAPIARNHRKYGRNLLILFGGGVVGMMMEQWNQYYTNAIAAAALMASSIWAYSEWSRFRTVDEEPGPRPPRPSIDEIRRTEVMTEVALRRAWRAIRDAVRNRGRQTVVA